jgi:hypothetical protein
VDRVCHCAGSGRSQLRTRPARRWLRRDEFLTPRPTSDLAAGDAEGSNQWRALEWHPASDWRKVPGSEAAGANGLELSNDDRWYYVAAWGSQSFFRLSRGQPEVTRNEIPLGFRVDNLRWSVDGTLLAAGQGGSAEAPESIVVKVNPATLSVKELVRYADGNAFG